MRMDFYKNNLQGKLLIHCLRLNDKVHFLYKDFYLFFIDFLWTLVSDTMMFLLSVMCDVFLLGVD